MALPEDHLAKFHKMTDAKEMWDAIKSRFGGNDKSKKMQKYILKQQFEGFSVSNTKGLHKNQGNQDNRRRDDWGGTLEIRFGSRTGKKEDSKALVIVDGEGVDWTSHSEEDKDYALMACNSSESDTEFGLGYGDHRYDGILSYENEVLQSVFMNKESELEKQPLYDRFVTAGGMHVVPPPMTGNYMPSGPDIEVDYSQFTYGPKQTQPSESESQSSEFDTCESNISTEPSELVSEPVVNESNVECQPKVWSDAPIIEEYESDSEDEYVSIPTKQQETPSFANQQVKTPRETVKNQFTHSQKPKVDKKELGYGFTVRACFVCGSLNHLIRDCDFHEKRMARKAELNNGWNRKSSQREIRQTWNNVQRVNKQNQFVPSAVLTRTGKIPVNTARASVSAVGGKRETAVKPSAGCNWRPQRYNAYYLKYSMVGSSLRKMLAFKDSTRQDSSPKQAWVEFRHMFGNKAYLAEFQDFNGGPVAFGGSKGYITGKVTDEIQNSKKHGVIEKKEIEPDEEPARGTLWLKGRVNKDGEYPDDEIRSVGDKLKETEDKIKEGTLKVDHGTNAMTVVLGKEKEGYARGVSPMDINPINSSADEEGGNTIFGCKNDASIQKFNGLATLEKEMETRTDRTTTKQARIEADKLLAEKLQEQERKQFPIEERAKFLSDTIAHKEDSLT
ncbi:hypothetical protein Tco_0213715 [Tanacetum coccineum]